MRPIDISRALADEMDALRFAEPVRHVYNPLRYAFAPHAEYMKRYGASEREILLVGMNPGPWGMGQTGVPFGDVTLVRDWMGIEAPVSRPDDEHPKRRVQGFACPRGEVSGRRLWGWARQRFGSPEKFFARFFVINYCPLMFLEESGRNRTPDKLPSAERDAIYERCNRALARFLGAFQPDFAIGIGRFAERRLAEVTGTNGPSVFGVLHPSPASPAANRGWAEQFESSLAEHGVAI